MVTCLAYTKAPVCSPAPHKTRLVAHPCILSTWKVDPEGPEIYEASLGYLRPKHNTKVCQNTCIYTHIIYIHTHIYVGLIPNIRDT